MNRLADHRQGAPMPDLGLPQLQPHAPATFHDRGVSVPFTTPHLFGARLRGSAAGDAELLLPNPAGGRGIYVVGWRDMAEIFRPTLHDRYLTPKLAALPVPTPAGVRAAARAVAAEGLAGEDALAAAEAATAAAREDFILGNFALLMTLVRHVDPAAPAEPLAATRDMEQRARRAVGTIAAKVARPPEWVAEALEAISSALHAVGVRDQPRPAHARRLLALLEAVASEIHGGSEALPDSVVAQHARIVLDGAQTAVALAGEAVAALDALAADPAALLTDWAADPSVLSRAAEKIEWMLDGWEPLCLLWRNARTSGERRAVLAEIAPLVPAMPREAMAAEPEHHEPPPPGARRVIQMNEDWRSGAMVFERVARNERLRAQAA